MPPAPFVASLLLALMRGANGAPRGRPNEPALGESALSLTEGSALPTLLFSDVELT